MEKKTYLVRVICTKEYEVPALAKNEEDAIDWAYGNFEDFSCVDTYDVECSIEDVENETFYVKTFYDVDTDQPESIEHMPKNNFD